MIGYFVDKVEVGVKIVMLDLLKVIDIVIYKVLGKIILVDVFGNVIVNVF